MWPTDLTVNVMAVTVMAVTVMAFPMWRYLVRYRHIGR
eukprot:SAG11_NODE_31734_length_289_cov_1.363158_1_plen_37_part_01